jgi:peptidoglycan hydrolase-like protein with peptidoglycan-binding domain
MKRVAAALVAVMIAGTLVATPASPAAAALPSCSEVTLIPKTLSRWVELPVAAPNGNWDCLLGEGNQGRGVRALQLTLNGCFGSGLFVDGVFGPRTRSALISAQAEVGATRDGVYGPQTRIRFHEKKKWWAWNFSPSTPGACVNLES